MISRGHEGRAEVRWEALSSSLRHIWDSSDTWRTAFLENDQSTLTSTFSYSTQTCMALSSCAGFKNLLLTLIPYLNLPQFQTVAIAMVSVLRSHQLASKIQFIKGGSDWDFVLAGPAHHPQATTPICAPAFYFTSEHINSSSPSLGSNPRNLFPILHVNQ